MPTKIKLIITFIVTVITNMIFYKHFSLNEYLKGIIILIIGTIMIFGLWILPEAKGKTKDSNEKIYKKSSK